ncbi:MAG TPA: SAM-dependent methyltransferase, partial [Polyangia bacterium]|nr:SAM-dependent methyltransferase [Polyangia bacterium]
SAGSETALREELARDGHPGHQAAAGVVTVEGEATALDPVFARQALPDARPVAGPSVRALAEAAYGLVEGAVDAWPGPFLIHDLAHAEPPPGLASRAAGVARELRALLAARRKRASRRERPPAEVATVAGAAAFDDRWLLVQLLALSRDRLLVSAAAPRALPRGGVDLAPWPGGGAPVDIDRAPPSRAYQKLEEAFLWMGAEPGPSDRCVDLGASPGGWTATLRKRRAPVIAVDRAPLAPALARDPGVETVLGNAFTYTPPRPVDWMVSDVVCEPPRSLGLAEHWVSSGLCRNLIVTVKFKGQSGYGVLAGVAQRLIDAGARFARVKQLAHNKNEVTLFARR